MGFELRMSDSCAIFKPKTGQPTQPNPMMNPSEAFLDFGQI